MARLMPEPPLVAVAGAMIAMRDLGLQRSPMAKGMLMPPLLGRHVPAGAVGGYLVGIRLLLQETLRDMRRAFDLMRGCERTHSTLPFKAISGTQDPEQLPPRLVLLALSPVRCFAEITQALK